MMHKKVNLFLILISFLWMACEKTQKTEWEDPSTFQINQEMPRANFFPFESEELALINKPSESKYYLSLNGQWKFNLSSNPKEREKSFYKETFDDAKWPEITVPGSWELQGWSVPIYLDEEYPFTPNPPFVPHDYNTVGAYRKSFIIPQNWNGREVFIRFGSVRSAFYLWINGKKVGYGPVSYTHLTLPTTPYV